MRLTFHDGGLVSGQDTQALTDLHQAATYSSPYTCRRTLTLEHIRNRKTQGGGNVTPRRPKSVCNVLDKSGIFLSVHNVSEEGERTQKLDEGGT